MIAAHSVYVKYSLLRAQWLVVLATIGVMALSGCSAGHEVTQVPRTIQSDGIPEVLAVPKTAKEGSSKETTERGPSKDVSKSPATVSSSRAVQEPNEPEVSASNERVPKNASDVVKEETKRMKKAEKSFVAAVEREEDGNDNVFPAAIAEVGHAACERLAFLQTADSSSIPAVLVSNEIPQAATAIKYICPEFAPQLKESSEGFGDGESTVGQASGDVVTPGRYFTKSKAEDCSWAIFDAKEKLIESGSPLSQSELTEIKIPVKAKSIISTGCYAWMPNGK